MHTRTLPFAATLAAMLAVIAAPAAAQTVGHDGWIDHGGYSTYVGTPGPGKSRAEVLRELAEHRARPIAADGWRLAGDGYVFEGHGRSAGFGKTRAQVLMELEAFRANPVGPDGWTQGDSGRLFFVGTPPRPLNGTAGAPAATRAQ
jgi:hypothetical protein